MFALGYSLAAEALDRRARRLATDARYRVSEKGRERALRYNSSTAHREASRRWRLCHVPGPDSSQDMMGRWTNLMKIDPADKVGLGVQAQQCGGWGMFWLYRHADTTAAQRLLSEWGLSHQLLPGPPDADLVRRATRHRRSLEPRPRGGRTGVQDRTRPRVLDQETSDSKHGGSRSKWIPTTFTCNERTP